MAKFSKHSKLAKRERQELLLFFCDALTNLNKKEEVAEFLTDLLSPQELEMLSKRLEIARLLIQENTYQTIKAKLKVSDNTIARVNAWLTLSGRGFRLVIKRTKKEEAKSIEDYHNEKYDPYSWYNIKRRYSMYFLPELLIEELMKRSSKKEQEKIVSILSSIEGKPELFKTVQFQKDYNKVKRRTYK